MNHRYTRAVRKVSCHFEYLENRSHGLDVTWQQIRRDPTVQPWTLSRGASQSAVRSRSLSLCTVWPSHFTTTEWAAQLHHNNAPAHSIALMQAFLAKHHITQVYQVCLQPRFCTLWLNAFPKAKITIERMGICESNSHTLHKLSQRRLTADRRVSQGSDCSKMPSKVSSDWLSSYIKVIWPVLEIFKMARYFLYSTHVVL
jgi:hypothetical protein